MYVNYNHSKDLQCILIKQKQLALQMSYHTCICDGFSTVVAINFPLTHIIAEVLLQRLSSYIHSQFHSQDRHTDWWHFAQQSATETTFPENLNMFLWSEPLMRKYYETIVNIAIIHTNEFHFKWLWCKYVLCRLSPSEIQIIQLQTYKNGTYNHEYTICNAILRKTTITAIIIWPSLLKPQERVLCQTRLVLLV